METRGESVGEEVVPLPIELGDTAAVEESNQRSWGGEWIGGVSGDLQVASLNFLEERREKILWKGDLTNITGIKRREREAK